MKYLNFLDLGVVDYETDCYDDTHLNRSGAEKVTTYLGDYLAAHYTLSDHRNDPAYASWHGDYETWRTFQHALLREEDQLFRYLMLLANETCSFELTLGDDRLFAAEPYGKLLRNIGIDEKYPTVTLPGADLEIRVRDLDTGEEFDAVQGTFELNTAGELIDVKLRHV